MICNITHTTACQTEYNSYDMNRLYADICKHSIAQTRAAAVHCQHEK
jgi:hypothetical protein